MLIDRSEIARLIPHTDDMCLLDGVLDWDTSRIQCMATTHGWAGNPLWRDGQLGILCGIEYAVQAMALHAALAGGETRPPRRGYLASLRSVTCHEPRLDLIIGQLVVEAERVHGETSRMIYRFAVQGESRVLLDGRAIVVLEDIAA